MIYGELRLIYSRSKNTVANVRNIIDNAIAIFLCFKIKVLILSLLSEINIQNVIKSLRIVVFYFNYKKGYLYLRFFFYYDNIMNELPTPPIQLSKKAMSELKVVLEQDIGKEALGKLSEAEINHIGCMMLTLTSIQLKIQIREKKRQVNLDQ
ncbi:hypothetical protein H2O64_21725 [Kordia sp. YSTF-M3]|uniref:Uncharacterized protein n=1 Tax=Kordia aestuariivivens TaxID=2759037 RepID=A0ABR7QFG2_9FLAO|nr:hypothetical protein [Kordia aestuariivivens]MBC8757304.1 hypothetical protein [Kordia aestuariivivens]